MDYYKITNETETHYGLRYKTGLNEDIVDFYPYGDCLSGGIYFAREDILCFLNYGPWIRKVTLPEDALIYENPNRPKKWKANKVILGEREEINFNTVKRLIDEGADPKANDSEALRHAAYYGHTEIVKFLIPISDPQVCNSQTLRMAAHQGYADIVKLLIPVSDPKACNSEALRYAAYEGHVETVKLLIPVSDPKANNSAALRDAAIYGHTEIVKLLIPVSDPKAYNSEALRTSLYAESRIEGWRKNAYTEIIKLLEPVS